jgi:hypothetical protein
LHLVSAGRRIQQVKNLPPRPVHQRHLSLRERHAAVEKPRFLSLLRNEPPHDLRGQCCDTSAARGARPDHAACFGRGDGPSDEVGLRCHQQFAVRHHGRRVHADLPPIDDAEHEIGLLTGGDRPVDAGLLDAGRQGKLEAHLIGWSGRVDPDLNLTPLLSCKAAGNDGRYCNPALDELLAQAWATADVATRKALYAQVTATILDDAPVIYLHDPVWIFATTVKLKGFKAFPDGTIRLEGVTPVR